MEKMEQIGKAVLDYRFIRRMISIPTEPSRMRCWRSPEIVHLSNMNV